MNKNIGGAAFPRPYSQVQTGPREMDIVDQEGMSLRAYFAAHAPVTIQDAIVAEGFDTMNIGTLSADQREVVFRALAGLRADYADAMIDELEAS